MIFWFCFGTLHIFKTHSYYHNDPNDTGGRRGQRSSCDRHHRPCRGTRPQVVAIFHLHGLELHLVARPRDHKLLKAILLSSDVFIVSY